MDARARFTKGFAVMDDRRVYSDEEFAVILRKASELSAATEPPGPPPGGLTLAEMKAAAAQAGFDPALVERAARMLALDASAPSLPERLLGGPVKLGHEGHFPLRLDEAGAARLLSAIQIGVGRSGEGHASGLGVVWHSSEDAGEVLRVTARTEPAGTSVAVDLDRRGTLAIMGTVTMIGSVTAWIAGVVLANEVAPAVGIAATATGMGGLLAVGRGYWTASTRKARERIGGILDALGGMLDESAESRAIPPAVEEGKAGPPTADGSNAAAAPPEMPSPNT